MGYISTTFLGKEYSIPEDVLTYIDLLDFTANVKTQLVNVFIRKLKAEIAKDNIGLLGDEDLESEIEQQTGKFIAKLCDNGIFTRTIRDYLTGNKGYQLISDVNKSALEKMKSLLLQELDAWQAGYENAVNRAESHVTGMGFSIWSSSFINHAIYAAMEASTLNKQGKEAEVQYQRDMTDLRSRLDSKYGGEKSKYINNTYIPNMEAALTVFAYELLDKYVADLIANGKFDAKTLEYIDIGRSNDLLKNLTLSNNKKAILENAFVACPYNIAVYMQAMKYDLLDYASFLAADLFKRSDILLDFLKESIGTADYPKYIQPNLHSATLLALYTNKNVSEVLSQHTVSYANAVLSEYRKIAKALNNHDHCCSMLNQSSEDNILAGEITSKRLANSLVRQIVSDATWNSLVEQCGHTDLFKKLLSILPDEKIIHTKKEFDDYLIKELTAALELSRKTLVQRITARRNLEEEARHKAEKAQHQKRIKTTLIFGIIVAVIIFAISLPSILERKEEAKREAAIESTILEVTTALEQKIESQIDDDIEITYSYEDFSLGYSLMWSFKIRMTKFEEFRNSGGQDEALLREILSNCEIIEEIIEEEDDSFNLVARTDDWSIEINNYDGSVYFGDLSSYDTFYFEVRRYTDHIDRYLYSRDEEYIVVDKK